MAVTALQWAGASLVMIGTAAAGFAKAERYRRRPRELRRLASVLRALKADVSFARTPLPEAMSRASDRAAGQPALARLLQDIAQRLETPGMTAAGAFEAVLADRIPLTALSPEDGEILAVFGKTAGLVGSAEQEAAIAAAIQLLEEREREALDDRARFERLYQTAGVLAGILIVILLI